MRKSLYRYNDIKLRRDQINQERYLKEKELDILKSKNDLIQDDLDTKNRVDISLKEYEELQNKIKDLDSENSYYKNVFEQLKLDEYLHYLDLSDVNLTTYEMFEQNKKYVNLRICLKQEHEFYK